MRIGGCRSDDGPHPYSRAGARSLRSHDGGYLALWLTLAEPTQPPGRRAPAPRRGSCRPASFRASGGWSASPHAVIRGRATQRLRHVVAEIFCFRDLGLKKADARFWDAVVARLAVPRTQMLMVGDDLDNDVLAPRRAGIASVWLNWKRAPTPAGVVVSMIERLDQLPSLLAADFA
ncbi:MAG: HAD family hydrolase [Deltaproteobacteria bacterium]|nr:MAG: HAD family hydrolase [Deltaproteobacteria bacterium]